LLAGRHEAGHLGLGDGDFLAAPGGEPQVLDDVIGGALGGLGGSDHWLAPVRGAAIAGFRTGGNKDIKISLYALLGTPDPVPRTAVCTADPGSRATCGAARYSSSPKRPATNTSRAAMTSAAWGPDAVTVIEVPGAALSIRRPMIESPPTLSWPRVTV